MSFIKTKFLPAKDDHLATLNEMTILIGDAAQSLVAVITEANGDKSYHSADQAARKGRQRDPSQSNWRLVSKRLDPQDIIARKDLYESLGDALSHCHSVGTLIRRIAIKNV